jgi:peptidoglycan hydrolase-like protein with peptidoglycan-binding domain
MRLRKMMHLALAFGLTAGLGVSTASAGPQKSSHRKTASAKSGNTSRKSKSSKHSSRRERGQKAPAPERISEIQEALGKDGAYAGTPNGKWDASTVEAMKKFQAAQGLNPTGKLDALTLQKLGLGSQTAGIAAPMPPISSSSVTNAASQTAHRQQ